MSGLQQLLVSQGIEAVAATYAIEMTDKPVKRRAEGNREYFLLNLYFFVKSSDNTFTFYTQHCIISKGYGGGKNVVS